MNQSELLAKAKLVMERLKNLQRPENEETVAGSAPDGGKSVGLYRRDFGMKPWDWPQGVGLYGMFGLYEITKDEELLAFMRDWYKGHLEAGLPVRNINTSAPMLAMAFLQGELGAKAADAAADWAKWLLTSLPKTKENGFQHTTTDNAELGTINLNQDEVWIDTLFMAVLFLAKYGVTANDQACADEAVHQFLFHIKYLYEKRTGLFYHGYTFKENSNFGGIFWCRGNCWYTAAVMELLDIMGDRLDGGVKAFLLDTYRAQIETLAKYQAPSGLWHTVVDDPSSYEEVSGSAGFARGILKGLRLGYLGEEYRACAEKAVEAIVKNIDADGTVLNVSAGTGMGYNAEHYKNIMIAPLAYGQSLVLMALSEAMR
jgi:unsaturated rhamnogalacturonyl hydrolase